jgi:hypothetical protein
MTRTLTRARKYKAISLQRWSSERMKARAYNIVIRQAMLHGAGTCPLKRQKKRLKRTARTGKMEERGLKIEYMVVGKIEQMSTF